MDSIKTGQLISNSRKALGLTQRNLAEKLRVSEQAVSKWERGRSLPDIAILVPLSKILHVSVYDLLEGEHVVDLQSVDDIDVRSDADATIQYYAGRMNLYRNMLYKSGYYILITAMVIAMNFALHLGGLTGDVDVPPSIFLGIAVGVGVVALIIAIIEKRMNLTFFYAYDTHWQGNPLINSSFVFGVSMYFFYLNSPALAAVAFIIELALINVIAYFIKPSKKSCR